MVPQTSKTLRVKFEKTGKLKYISHLDLLLVHLYAGTANTAAFAERSPSSMVRPTSLGGEGGGNIEMPLEVTFGGQRTTGTASMSNGVPTFTAGE